MPKESLKEYLDGNELDLSLNNLTTVPVKEIAALPKAKVIDLSCNLLTTIPKDFCTLPNIVRIDLSKNKLQELPDNIGALQKLQHLDLYSNELTSLPLGMAKLKNLKWLDVKNNPLTEPLRSIAGDCLDEAQCRKCAVNVVTFMKNAQSERDRQRQKQVKLEREEEAKRKAQEEEEKRRQKQIKKLDKDRRRKELEARKKIAEKDNEEEQPELESCEEKQPQNGKTVLQVKEQKGGGISCCSALVAMFIGLIAVCGGLFMFCRSNTKDQFCVDSSRMLSDNLSKLQKHGQYWFDTLRVILLGYYDLTVDAVNEIMKSDKKTT